ncbi:hypothetical protein FIBSPDRAFT_605814 [Athelia psychrophila]|uniref:Uncharacterized protein n=1 Tax=Athelia psychrophila TaxID=1759441 RepID=A0A166GM29_9AGAM|nr:hypothetical protein FIBSPDRAFT_605814 [Fibularhizoctonia sp. CBS 109695]
MSGASGGDVEDAYAYLALYSYITQPTMPRLTLPSGVWAVCAILVQATLKAPRDGSRWAAAASVYRRRGPRKESLLWDSAISRIVTGESDPWMNRGVTFHRQHRPLHHIYLIIDCSSACTMRVRGAGDLVRGIASHMGAPRRLGGVALLEGWVTIWCQDAARIAG